MLVRRTRPLVTLFALLSVAPLLAGCRIEVPVSPGTEPPDIVGTAKPQPTAEPSSSPGADDLPPQTRAQILGSDMTLARGGYIDSAGTVAFADGLSRTPGWSPRRILVQGESVYDGESGCTSALRHIPVQGPLVVPGDDRASTEALFGYLDQSILPEYLTTTTWLWGESPSASEASIEFLTYTRPATTDSPASAISLRLFSATGTGLGITVSCPTDELLDASVADIRGSLSVSPPR